MSQTQPNNPLHGLTLEKILTRLVEHYGGLRLFVPACFPAVARGGRCVRPPASRGNRRLSRTDPTGRSFRRRGEARRGVRASD
jgi:hypothetical protein